MARRFSVQHVAVTPVGWDVQTVKAGEHRVRVAFPPGQPTKEGIPVQVLHPHGENPVCHKNPSELLLLGANPMRLPNLFGFSFGRKERRSYQVGDEVKVRFSVRGEAERIWVRITSHRGRNFTGVLLNDPVVIAKDYGDTVRFKSSQIVTD
jgi:hypothetical protein